MYLRCFKPHLTQDLVTLNIHIAFKKRPEMRIPYSEFYNVWLLTDAALERSVHAVRVRVEMMIEIGQIQSAQPAKAFAVLFVDQQGPDLFQTVTLAKGAEGTIRQN